MKDIELLNKLKLQLVAVHTKWMGCPLDTKKDRTRYDQLGNQYLKLSAQIDELNWKLQISI